MSSLPSEKSSRVIPGPYVIGATGGSGTRVVARIAQTGGMFIGSRLNQSMDSLDFGEYSDRWINRFMSRRRGPLSPRFETKMFADFLETMGRHGKDFRPGFGEWGWKEPRSIYLLPFFHGKFPALRFLHVVRDGRDMAFSDNQNQLRKHGHTLLSLRELFAPAPVRSILLWSRVNQMAADYGEANMPEGYLRIRFEDLCFEPERIINQMFNFFGLEGDVEKIAEEVKPPSTLGRWRQHDDRIVEKLEDAGGSALRRFGYLA